jgi:methionyl-tRNA formyltransferase
MALRLLFFGTPAFAVPSLTALIRSPHMVVGVVTQPDRPRGRGQKSQPEAIKRTALEHGLMVLQPERLKDPAFLDGLREHQIDLAVVAAYGRLLPQALLDLPRLGFINVHASLLPRWRGAAPVHRAILAGDHETGVTIMRVVLALDAGPMISQERTAINPDETSDALEARLSDLGARLLIGTIDRLISGTARETPQDDRLSTYAPRLERADGELTWARPAAEIHNQIRGLQPWPLATTHLSGRRLLLRRSNVVHSDASGAAPGTIVSIGTDGLVVAASPGAVAVLELQPEGKRAMPARDFANGAHVRAGDRFD